MKNNAPAEVWNSGGGTNSVAIGILITLGLLPKPDIALQVDTGREKASTWEYFDAILYPRLKAVGVEIHRVSKEKYATCDLWSTNGETLEIPAFTTETGGKIGKLSNFCSHEWKTRVLDRFLRIEHGIRGGRKWLGFTTDEPLRWMRQENKPLIRLPLVKDVMMTRQNCIDLIKGNGWPPAPRSACWMCPNQHDSEWLETKANRPHEFAMAVALQEEIQKEDPHAWLHKSAVPLDKVKFNINDNKQRACDSGNCFV